MQTFAEINWQFEDAVIRHQNDDVARGIKHCRADFAMGQVLLYISAHGRIERPIDILGDAIPYVSAVQNHRNLLSIPLFFCSFHSIRRSGTSFFCSKRRARCRRTFTNAMEIPSASAVSFTLNSSTSRRITTWRKLSGSSATASWSSLQISCLSSAADGISRQSVKAAGV